MVDSEVSRLTAQIGDLTTTVASIGAEVDALEAAQGSVQAGIDAEDLAAIKTANDSLGASIASLKSKLTQAPGTNAGPAGPAGA